MTQEAALLSDERLKAAQEALRELAPPVGSLWQHYKGALVEVLALAVLEDSLEPAVVYIEMPGSGVPWVRRLDDWRSSVDRGDGVWVARFTRRA